ncbi:MAG: hypothetical protein WDA27_08655 [Actinomycetota bacterium]
MSIVVGRAPGRVSLAGGGTDLPAYYERHGGAVVSFAIDSYAYGHASPRAADLELVSLDNGSRELVSAASFARRMRPPILAEDFLLYQKAVAWHFGIERGRLAASSEVPAGAGLASSGAVCVALVYAAAQFVGDELERAEIADTAARIEMDVLRRSCGKQDQYASAFGGLNLIEFFRDGSVDVTPLKIRPEVVAALESGIMLFHNGARRSSVSPLQEQARRSASDPDTVDALHRLKDMAYEMCEVLERGDVDDVGAMLHRAWEAKQHLNSQVSTPEIARVYGLARSAGATGGKLAGAGLTGTLVLYCPEGQQQDVRRMLATQGWRERRMRIDWEGAALAATVGAEHDRAGP